MKAVGSRATTEVKETLEEVYRLFQHFDGERRERLQQVADHLGVGFLVALPKLTKEGKQK